MRCPSCKAENVPGTPLCRECGATLPRPGSGGEPDSFDDTSAARSRHRETIVHTERKIWSDSSSAGEPSPPAFAWIDELRELVAAGKKIEAVKLVRERTGVGLKEAKDAVDAMEQGRPFTITTTHTLGDAQSLDEVTAAINRGDKIGAVKAYREQTGAGLAEAKQVVESIMRGPGGANRISCSANLLLVATVAVMIGGIVAAVYALR